MKQVGRILTLGVAIGGAVAPVAFAQEANRTLDEITVTAQRREQSVQDVPISITAFSGDQLRDLGVRSTIDLALVTPGLTIGQNSGDGDFPFISLRGVTLRDFADTNESPSAVYVNEFYKANLVGLDGQIFDMKRVEVLRGPQGTLYGRNATGGLIHYITNAPTKELDGYLDLTAGDFGTIRAEGAVSGSLSETLSARLSVLHSENDGWLENAFANNLDGNGLDATSVRLQLLFEPTDASKYSLMLQRSTNSNDNGNMFTHFSVRQDAVTGLAVSTPALPGFSGYRDPTGSDPRVTNSDRDIFFKTEQSTAVLRGEWQFSGVELVSISGVERSEKDATFDSDSTPFVRGTEVHPRGEQYSQEFRLSGATEQLQWLAGLYYIDYNVGGSQSRCLPATCASNRNPVLYDLDTQSWAAFGNIEYGLTDALSVTAGLRYTSEKKEYVLNNTDAVRLFSVATVGDLAKQDDSATSFDLRLNYKANDALLLYGGVARGFKAGTFNVGYTPINNAAVPVRPEELTSYEIGMKSTFSEERVTFNAAIFNYDYKDSQAFQFDGRTLSSTAFNRDAKVTGAEAELGLRPAEGLDLRLIATYLDEATLDDVQLPGLSGTGVGLAPRDTRMPLAPKLSVGLLARYEFGVPWGGRLALLGGVTYQDEQYFDAFNSPAHFEPSRSIAQARVSWTSEDEHWRVAVAAENLTDEIFRTYSFDLAFLNLGTSVYGRPRWVTGTIGYSW
jgi:iron complex outermembrane recepter protein